MIFQDFSAAVLQKSKSFKEFKKTSQIAQYHLQAVFNVYTNFRQGAPEVHCFL